MLRAIPSESSQGKRTIFMPRREFLQTAIGVVSGVAMPNLCHAATTMAKEIHPPWTSEYERGLTATSDFDWLGIPKSWSCVRQGFHPFSPERTLVLNSTKVNRHPMVPDLVERTGRHLDEFKIEVQYDPATLAHIAYCAAFLTESYGIPSQAERWCKQFAGSFCGFYGHMNGHHLFMQQSNWQGRDESVSTTNDLVDWWLFLIPDGLETYSLADKRLHVLITPVYSHHNCFTELFQIFCPMAYAVGSDGCLPDVAEEDHLSLSRMDQRSACHFLNQRVAGIFTDTSQRWAGLLRVRREMILKLKDLQSR